MFIYELFTIQKWKTGICALLFNAIFQKSYILHDIS